LSLLPSREFAALRTASQTENFVGAFVRLALYCRHFTFITENTMKKLTSMTSVMLAAALLTAIPVANADTAAHKFGRGLAGMTCGVMELPGNILKETRAQGAAGLPMGLAKGVGMIVTRELVGVYEFVTAPFPLPAGFRPILQPEYPWSYFN
jgi:putative exosortase-associated protein (TIGR04073 family)